MSVAFYCLLALMAGSGAIAAESMTIHPEKTRVVLLGVDHAAQLVSRNYRPAVLEAFISRTKPDAICIERDPERFAVGDLYEFTYEVNEIIIPYARRSHIEICPIDWEPPKSDQVLGFGADLDAPPAVRAVEGYQGFLTFPSKAALSRDLFWAEDRSALKEWDSFSDTTHEQPGAEMSRRLFLYRTALQARRIEAAAGAHPGRTILVIVGAFHERDIKQFLSKDSNVELLPATEVGSPSAEEIAAHENARYDLAALTFNLLGLQSRTGFVDYPWMSDLLQHIEQAGPVTVEARFLRLRLDRLQGRTDAQRTVKAYQGLLPTVPADARFTWTGVKDGARLDSYFDPFGAMTIRQRLRLEIARELYAIGKPAPAEEIRAELAGELKSTAAAQFAVYWPNFVKASAAISKERRRAA